MKRGGNWALPEECSKRSLPQYNSLPFKGRARVGMVFQQYLPFSTAE